MTPDLEVTRLMAETARLQAELAARIDELARLLVEHLEAHHAEVGDPTEAPEAWGRSGSRVRDIQQDDALRGTTP